MIRLVKGFKDEDGKFHPTEKKGGISSKQLSTNPQSSNPDSKKASELKKEKGRIKTIPEVKMRVFDFDELEPDVQEKIIENRRQSTLEFGDTFFADDEFLISDPKTKFDGQEIFKNTIPKFFEVDSNRGTDFVQFELAFKNDTDNDSRLGKFLGLSKDLNDKINFKFINDSTRFGGENNTRLEFTDSFGNEVDDDYFRFTPEEIKINFGQEVELEKSDLPKLEDAKEKWDDLMSQALQNLTRNFEASISDETLREDIKVSELEFEKDGTPA